MTSALGNTDRTVEGEHLIKRYANRKLYDTARSRYVTLDDIATMIKAGDELRIIDNESKEDLTSVTLAQIIFEEEKRESRMSLAMLRNLIQTGGTTLQEFFERSVRAPVAEIRDTAQRSVEKSVEEWRQGALQIRDAATKGVFGFTDSAKRIWSAKERQEEELRSRTRDLAAALKDQLSRAKGLQNEHGEGTSLGAKHCEHLRRELENIGSLLDDLQKDSDPKTPTDD